ncbi:hypothetical protein GGS23DRAFT_491936 [Durotheca rogersii]|uniref:uncharacterized protein n=1 Tax=Durotheca rogersii TaxID=419775 RepID=UPI00221FDFF8|nr:uncharacterized protein GGS23DRAFT_491936 [Durotheca rogersii]KAI5864283.1 hypothetical protein GGS23DRAFT_491936 [Durotheca rogersii]
MGWLWSSPSSSDGPNPGSNSRAAAEKPAPTAPPPAKPAAESEYSDPEIAKFIAQLQAELGGSGSGSKPSPESAPEPATTTPTPSTASSNTSSSSSSPWSLWSSSTQDSPPPYSSRFSASSVSSTGASAPGPGSLDPVGESLLPTTMSCRQAFDAAFHCNSIGGQWTSVYRYGTARSCSEHWDDFWFCMRTRAYSGPTRERAIRDHYRRRNYDKYYAPGRPSSADVWEPRSERLPVGEAFREPIETPDVDDEEWRRLEIERRRRIREALRLDAEAEAV